MTTSVPAQETAQSIQVTISTQYIKDFSFESPHAPHVFVPSDKTPALNVGINVQTRPLAENAFEVLLLLKLEASLEGKTVFIAELSYGGVVSVPALPENQLKYVLLVEAPRLLFPFARNIVANAVRDGGFPQLLINPIDFAALYQAQMNQMEQPAQGSA